MSLQVPARPGPTHTRLRVLSPQATVRPVVADAQRKRMGEEKLGALIQESLCVATRFGAAKPSDFTKVIVETTVQSKAVAFPTDASLCIGRARGGWFGSHGVPLRQSSARVGKPALMASAVRPWRAGPKSARASPASPDRGYRGHNARPASISARGGRGGRLPLAAGIFSRRSLCPLRLPWRRFTGAALIISMGSDLV